MDDQHIKKLEKILEYKERINHNVKDIRDIISTQRILPSSGDIIKDVLVQQKIRSMPIDSEIKKKIDEIIHSMSCIGLLWREDKAGDFQSFLNNLQNLFNMCFNTDHRMKYQVLEIPLDIANSLVVPIHESKKWSALIELDPLLAKIKFAFKNHQS